MAIPFRLALVVALTAVSILLAFIAFSPTSRYSVLTLPFQHPSNETVVTADSSKRPDVDALDDEPQGAPENALGAVSGIDLVHNDTLGFQAVFAVGLADRTDKRDALSLAAALTGIKPTWVDGVRGEQIPDKALPYGVDRKAWNEGGLGCWRSEMNVIRRIVEENITTALLLEDDADWDIRVKETLVRIAEGTGYLLNLADDDADNAAITPKSTFEASHSPYGDDWDVLWLGHCGDTFPEALPEHSDRPDSFSPRWEKVPITDDATMPSPEHTVSWLGDLSASPHTRWVHFSGGPICTAAYALSQKGAQKALMAMSVEGLSAPIDNAMSTLCRYHSVFDRANNQSKPAEDVGVPWGNGLDMKCLSVTPAVFSQHRSKGHAGGSDIQEGGTSNAEKGSSENIVWSARLNTKNLILGLDPEDQFKKA